MVIPSFAVLISIRRPDSFHGNIIPVIIGKLMNIGGMLRKKADQILQPCNLNQQQFSILFSIGQEGRVNQKNMVTRMVLEKAHVSKVVKKLHTMDLISIEPCSEDKRSSWLSLTSRGEKVLRECSTGIAAWNKEWTAERLVAKPILRAVKSSGTGGFDDESSPPRRQDLWEFQWEVTRR